MKSFVKSFKKQPKKKNSVFFFGCGEGRGVIEDNIAYSDCSGWLIPNDKVEEFRADFESFKDLERWEEFSAWVTWKKKNGEISVDIKLI